MCKAVIAPQYLSIGLSVSQAPDTLSSPACPVLSLGSSALGERPAISHLLRAILNAVKSKRSDGRHYDRQHPPSAVFIERLVILAVPLFIAELSI